MEGVDVAGSYEVTPGGVAPGGVAPGAAVVDLAGPTGTAECGRGGATDGPAGAALRGPGGVTRGESACTIVPGASTAVNRDHALDQPSRVRGQLSSGCDTGSSAGQIP